VLTRRIANPLGCAPRNPTASCSISASRSHKHVCPSSCPRRPKPPLRPGARFLQNHLADLVSVDFFVVPERPRPSDPLRVCGPVHHPACKSFALHRQPESPTLVLRGLRKQIVESFPDDSGAALPLLRRSSFPRGCITAARFRRRVTGMRISEGPHVTTLPLPPGEHLTPSA